MRAAALPAPLGPPGCAKIGRGVQSPRSRWQRLSARMGLVRGDGVRSADKTWARQATRDAYVAAASTYTKSLYE